MKCLFVSSLILRALALSTESCQELLKDTKWGPTGGHETECNCMCGECEGPANYGQPPPCTTPGPPPPGPDWPTAPPAATPPPPPPLAPLQHIPSLDWSHLPTLAPVPVGPPEPWRWRPTPPPPPPMNNTNGTNATNITLLSMSVSTVVRRAARVAHGVASPSLRTRHCMALLQQLPPPPAECSCECSPCNVAAATPAPCVWILAPEPPPPAPVVVQAGGTPPPPKPTSAPILPMAPLAEPETPIGELPPLSTSVFF